VTVKGIDVAKYQSEHYSTAGLDFVVVKATEGTSYRSPTYAAQLATGRAAKLVVGHYHYAHEGGNAEADYFLAHSDVRPGEFIAFDWEETSTSEAERDAWVRRVWARRPGVKVVVYCNKTFWKTRDSESFAGNGLWIADPSSPAGHPDVEFPWTFHQYSSAGGIDRNVGNFADRAALIKWAGGAPEETEDEDMQLSDDDARKIARQVVTGAAGMHAPDDRTVDWALSSWVQEIYRKVTVLENRPAPAPEIDYAKLAAALIAAVDDR
jgi:hypothetical protein